jgi:serine/threonine protein kinase
MFETKDVKIINFSGSDLFKAPEMLNFEHFNPFKAEIYSIGVTMIYFLMKKFYKSKIIKDWNDEEKNKILEDLIASNEAKNEFVRNNSKILMMKSNSLLSRPRKSSLIYNNFEKSINKEYVYNLEEIKPQFDYFEETEFYYFLKSFIEENPEQRIDINNTHIDF